MSTGSQPGASAGPVNSEESTTTRVTAAAPARRASVPRVATRAAPAYADGRPTGAADRVTSPPPTSTTSPGCAPATTRVVSRWSGSVTDSTAAEVASFAVEAGITGVDPPRSSSTSPVPASSTVADTRPPSRTSPSGPASARATPAGLSAGPELGSGSTGPGAVSAAGVADGVPVGAASEPDGSRPARYAPVPTPAAPTSRAQTPATATRAPVHRTPGRLVIGADEAGRPAGRPGAANPAGGDHRPGRCAGKGLTG